MTTPYAKGLFQKAIVQSGATEEMGVRFSDKEISQRIGELTLENLGIDESNLEDIQTVFYQDILDASEKARIQAGEEYGIYQALSTDYGVEWGPVVDGDYMPTNPVTEDGFADVGKDLTLLNGSNPYHGAEIPYMFENTSSTLSEEMGEAWANFARNGTPSAEGMPEWEPYTREGGATMLIDESSEIVYHHDQELMSLLEPDYQY